MAITRRIESGTVRASASAADARPFDLIRWFAVAGLAAIALVSIVTSYLLSQFLTHHMLERDGALTAESIQTITRVENTTQFFTTRQYVEGDRNLHEFFQYLGSLHDIMRANVYATDGTVIWSTDATLIGKRYNDNHELEEALEGKPTFEWGKVGDAERFKLEHANLGKAGDYFIENYIPVRQPQTGAMLGVVELYRMPNALFETIQRGTLLIWTAALCGGVFLYLVLFWIVRRADRTIRLQQKRLVESETLAVVGELAGSIAHGLRNPLSSIRTSAELAADSSPEEVRSIAVDITSEVDRLERMVRQLLAYSQAPTVALDSVDVGRVLRGTARQFARDLERRNVEPLLDVAPSLPPVRADEALLEQLLNSLVANALDAMPKGGTLTIAARPGGKRKTIEVTVGDTGVGIPRDRLADIFKPFRTSKPKGLGMGLALARRIMRRFGGTIAIDSNVGVGSTVTLVLREA
ncbi:MAG: ATP-binding protein [Burkholderiales bacterium]